MKAIIKSNVSNAVNYSRDKETVNSMTVYGTNEHGDIVSLVDARFYMSRSASASVVYCALWVHSFDVRTSGKGRAGGGGYHKESSALASAITDASIELWGSPYSLQTYNYDENRSFTAQELRAQARKANKEKCHFGGCGDSSSRTALMAIAKELKCANGKKYKKLFLGR